MFVQLLVAKATCRIFVCQFSFAKEGISTCQSSSAHFRSHENDRVNLSTFLWDRGMCCSAGCSAGSTSVVLLRVKLLANCLNMAFPWGEQELWLQLRVTEDQARDQLKQCCNFQSYRDRSYLCRSTSLRVTRSTASRGTLHWCFLVVWVWGQSVWQLSETGVVSAHSDRASHQRNLFEPSYLIFELV